MANNINSEHFSVTNVLNRIAETIINPSGKESYKGCCHAFTALNIRGNRKNIDGDINLVLLGIDGRVLHSVLLDGSNHIIADSQIHQSGIKSEFNPQGTYRSSFYKGGEEQEYLELKRIPMEELSKLFPELGIHISTSASTAVSPKNKTTLNF